MKGKIIKITCLHAFFCIIVFGIFLFEVFSTFSFNFTTESLSITLIPLSSAVIIGVITILSISISLQSNHNWGVATEELRRLHKGVTFTFLHMLGVSLVLIILNIVAIIFELWVTAFALTCIIFFYSIFFCFIEIPLMTDNNKKLWKIMRNAIWKEYKSRNNEDFPSINRVILSNMLNKHPLKEVHENLDKKEYERAFLLNHLLDSQHMETSVNKKILLNIESALKMDSYDGLSVYMITRAFTHIHEQSDEIASKDKAFIETIIVDYFLVPISDPSRLKNLKDPKDPKNSKDLETHFIYTTLTSLLIKTINDGSNWFLHIIQNYFTDILFSPKNPCPIELFVIVDWLICYTQNKGSVMNNKTKRMAQEFLNNLNSGGKYRHNTLCWNELKTKMRELYKNKIDIANVIKIYKMNSRNWWHSSSGFAKPTNLSAFPKLDSLLDHYFRFYMDEGGDKLLSESIEKNKRVSNYILLQGNKPQNSYFVNMKSSQKELKKYDQANIHGSGTSDKSEKPDELSELRLEIIKNLNEMIPKEGLLKLPEKRDGKELMVWRSFHQHPDLSKIVKFYKEILKNVITREDTKEYRVNIAKEHTQVKYLTDEEIEYRIDKKYRMPDGRYYFDGKYMTRSKLHEKLKKEIIEIQLVYKRELVAQNDTKTLSIIVPIYNAEKTLNKCLESIRGQTLKNFEVILVDNGSTDRSEAICKEFTDKDKRFRYIKHGNKNIVQACKKGIDVSRGNIIGFVDSDDFIDKEMYAKMLSCQKVADYDIVVTSFDKVKDGKKISSKCYPDAFYSEYDLYNIRRDYFVNNKDGDRQFYSSKWNKIFKREILEENITLYDDRVYEDEDMCIVFPAFYEAKTMALISESLYFYSLTENSVSRRIYPNELENQLYVIKALTNTLKKYDDDSVENVSNIMFCRFHGVIRKVHLLENKEEKYKLLKEVYDNEHFKSLDLKYCDKAFEKGHSIIAAIKNHDFEKALDLIE